MAAKKASRKTGPKTARGKATPRIITRASRGLRDEFRPRVGRPSIKTDELLSELLDRLSCGESLSSICLDDHMPNISVVIRWRTEDAKFKADYELAREAQADAYFEQLVAISDGDGSMLADAQRDRLRVDARKWALARMNRAKYGDRADINLGGQADNPIESNHKVETNILSSEERDALRKIGRRLATKGATE